MAKATPKLEQRKDPKTGILTDKNIPILIDFTFDGKRIWIPTGEKIDRNKWDEKNQRVKASVIGSLEINELIKVKCEQIQKIYREAKIMGKEPTASYLRNALNESKSITNKSLLQLYEEFIDGYKVKATDGTVKKLKTNKKHLMDFAKRARLSLDFDIIDEAFLNKYVEYFQVQLKHVNGTIAKNIKILKWFLNWATKLGYNKKLNYKSYSIKSNEPEIIILEEDELFYLYHLEINNECLRQVRDVFCFCCFTSLRYSDVLNLKKTDIVDNTIRITSIKTRSVVQVPIVGPAKEILSKYSNTLGNKALPVISNQNMNAYLKDLGRLAGLERPITKVRFRGTQRIETVQPLYEVLTTHVGRKTFISLLFRKGVDSELIRAISNHKSISSFARYNRISEEHKADAMHIAFKKVG